MSEDLSITEVAKRFKHLAEVQIPAMHDTLTKANQAIETSNQWKEIGKKADRMREFTRRLIESEK